MERSCPGASSEVDESCTGTTAMCWSAPTKQVSQALMKRNALFASTCPDVTARHLRQNYDRMRLNKSPNSFFLFIK